MLRKYFIKISALAIFGISCLTFQSQNTPISRDILIGKSNPNLTPNKLIHKEAYAAFLKMHKAALESGIDIQIVSGYRSFDRQLKIWNTKYKQYQKQGFSDKEIIKKITTYSTIPGTSRHHWGTDIDIIDASVTQPKGDLLLEENYHGNGAFCQLQEWMQTYAHEYGFYLVYTDNYQRSGFNYEPWHYSYKPLSQIYLRDFLKLDKQRFFENVNIQGEDNLDQNCLMSYFETHLLGINPKLLP